MDGVSQLFTQEGEDQLPKSHTTPFWVISFSVTGHYEMILKRMQS